MPGFDGTGPQGLGPMTGGARGRCNPNYSAGQYNFARRYPYGGSYAAHYGGYGYNPYMANPAYAANFYGAYGYGRGYGGGYGFGRGFGRGFGYGRGIGKRW